MARTHGGRTLADKAGRLSHIEEEEEEHYHDGESRREPSNCLGDFAGPRDGDSLLAPALPIAKAPKLGLGARRLSPS